MEKAINAYNTEFLSKDVEKLEQEVGNYFVIAKSSRVTCHRLVLITNNRDLIFDDRTIIYKRELNDRTYRVYRLSDVVYILPDWTKEDQAEQ